MQLVSGWLESIPVSAQNKQQALKCCTFSSDAVSKVSCSPCEAWHPALTWHLEALCFFPSRELSARGIWHRTEDLHMVYAGLSDSASGLDTSLQGSQEHQADKYGVAR